MWGFPVFLSLITRGGDVIRMVGNVVLLRSGLGWGNSPGASCRPASPGLQDLSAVAG